jgi:uncharacterized protein YbaP (TraB family)
MRPGPSVASRQRPVASLAWLLRALPWAIGLLAALFALPATAQRYDQGLLWRVESPAGASHVFGTIHVQDPRVIDLPRPVARAFNESRSVTVEVTLEPGNVMALASRMVLQDGRDLAGIAGAELFGRAAAETAKLGLPQQALLLFKPWAAALLLMAPQQDPEKVLDVLLARRAVAQGKPVHELETVMEQADVFDGMTEAEQVALLRYAVENREQVGRTTGELVKAWLARDLAAMWRISQEGVDASAEMRRLNEVFLQRVLVARNDRMAERMDARLKEGGAFVAIGALHLYGNDGVLALLARRGWRVTRVY